MRVALENVPKRLRIWRKIVGTGLSMCHFFFGGEILATKKSQKKPPKPTRKPWRNAAACQKGFLMGRQKQRFSGSSAEAATSSLGKITVAGEKKLLAQKKGSCFFPLSTWEQNSHCDSFNFFVTCERFPPGYLYGGLGWEKPTSKNAIYSLDLVPPLKMIIELGKNWAFFVEGKNHLPSHSFGFQFHTWMWLF